MIRRAAPRRPVAKRFAAAFALAILASGCPSRAPSPRPTASPSPSASIAPRGEIRLAYPSEPATLNPFLRAGAAPAARDLARPLLPPLFLAGRGADVQPWLVDRVTSESPRVVRFTLRTDAVWSDGRPIAASDVRFTWKTIMDPRWPIASRAGYDAITDVVAESATTVRIGFSRDMPGWRDLFSAGLGVLPEHLLAGKDFASALSSSWPVSGGPFVLSSYTRGLEMVLEANPRSWRVHPRVERIRVQFVPDSTTALQLLRAGKVDAVGSYSSPDFARRLGEVPGVSVSTDTGARWAGLVLNAKAGPLADVRVRRAIALATDRDDIVAGLVRDEGERLHVPFARPAFEGETTSGYDPAAAARALDEAGYTRRGGGVRAKGSSRLSISIASDGYDDLMQRIARAAFAQLERVGFEIDLVSLEDEQLWRDWLPSARMQAAFVTFADPPSGAVRARYHSSQIVPAGVNVARLADPAVDAAVDGADIAAQASALAAAVPVIPLHRVQALAGARSGFAGVRAVASADGALAFAYDWSAP